MGEKWGKVIQLSSTKTCIILVLSPPNPPNPTAAQLVFAIGNVYPQFSFKLTTDGARYKLWCRIFTDMCKGAKVMGHITGTSQPKGTDDEDWEAIDSRIKSWFYSTSEPNLLNIITKDNCTAKDLWEALDSYFLNNKLSRSLQLQTAFRNTKKGVLSITDYCHTLKDIADSLADVDTKISQQDLVLQILQHLPPSYQSLVDVITHTKPFPSFLKDKNMLLLHESREDKPDPTADTHLSPSSALYSTSTPNNNGKTRLKNNRGNKNTRRVTFNRTLGGGVLLHQTLLLFLVMQQVQNTHPNGPRRLPVPSAPTHGGIPVPSALFAAPPQAPQLCPSAPQFMDLASLFSSMSVQQPTRTQDNNYYMDTGASSHMSYNQGNLLSLKPCGKSKVIMVGNGALLPVSCIGDTFLPLSRTPLALKNVLVSDQMVKNLIYVRRYTIDNWVSVEFDPFGFSIKDLNTGQLLHRADSIGDLYPVLQSPQPSVPSATAFAAVSPIVWHRRLGHPGVSTFSFLKSRNFISCSDTLLPTCHACQLGKHCHLSFSHSTTKTSKVCELVHSDLWTSPISSLSGYKYYILFLDNFSHFLWVFPLRVKSDVFKVFCTFRAYVLNQFKTDIQSFQCDSGREFNNANLLTLFQNHGIRIRFSCPYTSQQNGKVERAIRTINNVMRTLLFQASLPPNLWAEALNMTVHPQSSPHNNSLVSISVRETLWYLSYLYALRHHWLSVLLQPVLYSSPQTLAAIYRLCLSGSDHFPYSSFNDLPPVSAYDDLLEDGSSPTLESAVTPAPTTSPESSQTSPVAPTTSGAAVPTTTAPIASDAPSTSNAPPATTADTGVVVAQHTTSTPTVSSTHPMTTTSRTRNLNPRQILNLSAVSSLSPIPTSTAQVVCDPHWKEAMDSEISPSCSGVFQQPGLDYDETFSPVVKPATIRTVLSISVSLNWPIHQLDVKNAFLNGDLTEEVYMKQPPGYVHPSYPNHASLRVNLIAPFFVYHHGRDSVYLLLYVDDIILTASSPDLVTRVISRLSSEFQMADLGALSFFLGVAATRSSSGLFLSQSVFAQEIISRASIDTCNPCSTPPDTKSKLPSCGEPVSDPTLYQSLAGALQYLTFTRPDISYAVQQICLFMHDPREPHFNALKRIRSYLRGTLSMGLFLRPSSIDRLVSYTDADWAGCPEIHRSTSGAEAEHRGIANAVAESAWLRNLLLELRLPLSCATVVFCDNVSAMYLANNSVQHQRTKHVEIDLHFVRERVALGHVRFCRCPRLTSL
ncbi:hypothetical protein OSB04_023293 [Centaurea solstitialis]|uniref:Integrase catalytic domain-containing protein n=1 Tax=Centaurea solstitialis TaxID=347529 RepID=A0AA38SX82_9ASTR|nr:hypothetical protein OSB04_023293 [Centaurea solstitialis]